MKPSRAVRAGLVSGLVLMGIVLYAAAPSPETPIGARWWPSEWGADDQRGAANRLTAGHVQEASRLIRDGKVYQLGRRYEHGMPMPPGKRHYSLTIPGSPTGGPFGQQQDRPP